MTSEFIPLLEPSPSDAPTRRSPQRRPRARRRPEPEFHFTAEEDRRLICELLDRSPEAWTEFLRRYERLIVSRILSACRETGLEPPHDLLEECGAEVMAALFHGELAGLRRFEGRSKLSTWLAVVVRRTTLRVLRRRRRDAEAARQPDSRFDLTMVPDDRSGQPTEFDADERAQLEAALEKLSAGDRLVLSLHFEQKLTYAQIGRALGITENAVGPKLHRAQERLKRLMKRG